jgi:rod shape-determining protein MreB
VDVSEDLAIDLGTASTRVQARRSGRVLDEPSVVAVRESGQVAAFGRTALALEGREPRGVRVLRPVRDGVVVDLEAAVLLLRACLREAPRPRRVVISLPRGVTSVEREALRETARRATGTARVELVDEPMAAALGAGVPVTAARGRMLVDLGGGITETVVIALGAIVCCDSARGGGQALDRQLAAHLRASRGIEIGERTAERLKLALLGGETPPASAAAKGRWVLSGLPGAIEVTPSEALAAVAPALDAIAGGVAAVFEELTPELAVDVAEGGILLSGGASLCRTLAGRVAARTGVPVAHVPDALGAVIRGNARVMEAS